MKKPLTLVILSSALTLLSSPAAVAQDAGSVTFATGSVTAEREPPVELAKGDTVLVADSIVTGDAARAQLLMIDGARVAIRPNSRLVVAEYAYTPPATPGTPAVATSDDASSVLNLVKGGFRTITGAIGKEDPAAYEVRTAVGVLGIRGTDYSAQLCRGDCDWAPGVAAGAAIPDGL
nr:FecR family protein [Woeseiaceae bacterium]